MQYRQAVEAWRDLIVADRLDTAQGDAIFALLPRVGEGDDLLGRAGIGGVRGLLRWLIGGIGFAGCNRILRQRGDRIGLAHVGPVDADVGHGIERCGRIDRRTGGIGSGIRRRLGRLRERSAGGAKRQGQET